MNRTVSLLITAISFLIAGWLSCGGIDWLLSAYFFPPVKVQVRGVLKFQAKPSDPSASGNPPNGYFVESTAIERFYVEGNLVKPYVGSLILIRGTLSTECGLDGYPCYPKLVKTSVIPAPGQK